MNNKNLNKIDAYTAFVLDDNRPAPVEIQKSADQHAAQNQNNLELNIKIETGKKVNIQSQITQQTMSKLKKYIKLTGRKLTDALEILLKVGLDQVNWGDK